MRRLRVGWHLLAGLGLAALLAGCAGRAGPSGEQSAAATASEGDPLEPFNRAMYALNTQIDTYTLKPAAEAYVHVVPELVRTGIGNVLSNLSDPVVLGNDMLEGKPQRAGDTLMRFAINSTVGLLGAVDVASRLGYPAHSADFGITLALWGVGGSPYLFLPILGPGDPRDSSGRIVDIAADPFSYVGQGAGVAIARWTGFGLKLVDQRSQYLGTFSQIRKTALDPYATFRSLFRQHRDAEIEKVRSFNEHTVPAWFPAPPPAQATAATQ